MPLAPNRMDYLPIIDRPIMVCIPYTSELNDAPLMRHHYEWTSTGTER